MWTIIWSHFPAFLVNGTSGIVFYEAAGIPFWVALIMLEVKGLVAVLFYFYGTDRTINLLNKWRWFRARLEKWQNRRRIFFNGRSKIRQRPRERFIRWLLKQSRLVITIALFVPYLGGASAVVARTVCLRHGVCLLILGAIFKAAIICWSVYSIRNL